MNKTGKIISAIAIIAVILLGHHVYLVSSTRDELVEKNQELQENLDKLTKEEKRSVVMQSVNAQMEEIANEERRISDEQREEAIAQTKVAEEMRRKAEIERQNALVAEQRAVEASEVARSQQKIAEEQRSQAEQSKRIADTLTYISLARTLGQTAITQYKADHHDIADLLAHTACLFTDRYRGDIYAPTVYQALAMTSQSKNVWHKHKGIITDVAFSDEKSGYMITCSTYGELMKHTNFESGKLNSEMLVSNPRYDFRDLFIDRPSNTTYALSRSGHLVIVDKNKKVQAIEINIPKPKDLDVSGDQFIIFCESGMALFDTQSRTIVQEKKLPFQIEYMTRYQNYPVAFDRQGNMHLIKGFNNIETSRVPVKGQVTAFAESKNQHLIAYGMRDGTIYLFNAKGQQTRLVGHQSRISKLKVDGIRLYSSSFDGTMNLWLTNAAKIEPMTLFTTRGWIINFTFDLKKTHVWSGDQNGNLTQALISVSQMQKRLQAKLKRNLTREEWNYYVGRNVPYEEVKGKEASR